jgi:glycerol uptake facilitator-like aquaporin
MHTRSPKLALAAIVIGILLAAAHIILGPLTGVMTRPEWISGLVLGILIAGVGNHQRIFGKR